MSALNQQADLQQRRKAQTAAQGQQGLKDQMEAYNQGAVDVPLRQQAPQEIQPGRPTLQKPYPSDTPVEPGGTTSSNPAPASPYSFDPKRTLNVGGKPVYFPTAAEKEGAKAQAEQEALNDSNSVVAPPGSQLEGWLQQETGYRPGTKIPMQHLGALMGVHKAIQDAQPNAPLDDTNSVVVTQSLSDKLAPRGVQLKPGSRLSFDKAAQVKDFVGIANPPEKAPKNLHFEPSTNDRGDVTMRGFDPETGEVKSSNTAKGLGPQRKDPDATAASDARAQAREDRQQAERDRAQNLINTLQTREKEQHQLRSAYGSILAQPISESKEANGQKVTVIDPDSRREEYLTPSRKAYYQDQYDAATGLRDTYHQQSTKLIKRYGGDAGIETFPPDKPAGSVSPATAPAPAPAAPAKQLPTGHKVGDSVTLKNGKTVKISKINSDGTFEGQ